MLQPIYFKYVVVGLVWIISIIMISLYAPADTVNFPILRKEERKLKKILSYVFASITLIGAIFIKDNTLSNIILINVLIESLSISKLAYKLTKNQYGYEIYQKG